MKGGISSGYKKFVEEKGLKDETYCADGIALIRVSGTSVHNNKTLQVDAVLFYIILQIHNKLNIPYIPSLSLLILVNLGFFVDARDVIALLL